MMPTAGTEVLWVPSTYPEVVITISLVLVEHGLMMPTTCTEVLRVPLHHLACRNRVITIISLVLVHFGLIKLKPK